jgi:hypothetical protein
MDQAGGTLHEATITFQPERPMATNHRGPGLTRSCAVREANRRRYCGDGMTKISSLPSPACLLYRGKCAQMAGKSGQSRPSKCTSPPAARWPPVSDRWPGCALREASLFPVLRVLSVFHINSCGEGAWMPSAPEAHL